LCLLTVKAMIDPVILVHGGAGDIPEWRVPLKLHGVRKAARAGYNILSKVECSALDAVEAAVKIMEDDEAFNAGIKILSLPAVRSIINVY
jgi:beta-aspartyl-peptidase (threonine type)